jgi:hypothetical protein
VALTQIDTKVIVFRIGAASYAYEKGLPDERIQLMGRWKSNAYKKYIRAPVLKI